MFDPNRSPLAKARRLLINQDISTTTPMKKDDERVTFGMDKAKKIALKQKYNLLGNLNFFEKDDGIGKDRGNMLSDLNELHKK